MKRKLYTNLSVSVLSNIIILVLSLVIPRLFLLQYGSDTNGLLTTLSQIFSYIALLEAGISQATLVQLYAPLKSGNREQISKIMSISRCYYRKVTVLYATLVVILAFIVPIIINSELKYWTIFLCVIFEGAAGVINFYFFSTQTILLNADGKGYVNELTNLAGKTASYVVKIVLALTGVSIVLIQFGAFAISLFKMLFYSIYMKRHYPWLNYAIQTNSKQQLPDRNAFVITELAWTLFSSTDAIVLSVFCSTKMASVYSINNMAFVAINSLVSAAYFGIRYELGKAYHEGISAYKRVHDSFNAVFMGIITALMGVSVLLLDSFISLYTDGVQDINYSYFWLPVLFCLVQMLSWSRYVSGNLMGIAGYAKKVSKISLLEAFLNVVLSVVLVNIWGICGVVFATVAALPIKVIYTNYISDKAIMKRAGFSTLAKLGVDFIVLFAIVCVRWKFPIILSSWNLFFMWGIGLTMGLSALMIGIHILIYPEFGKIIISKVSNKK